MEQRTLIKIYYEDTDALGIVYYANYLRYLERARSDMAERRGKPVQQWNQEGYIVAVHKLSITFLKPARLGDQCEVVTSMIGGSDYRRKLKQVIERGGEVITEAVVDLVCLDPQMQLQEFPTGIFD